MQSQLKYFINMQTFEEVCKVYFELVEELEAITNDNIIITCLGVRKLDKDLTITIMSLKHAEQE